MVDTPSWVRPQINVVYPPNSFEEYERWFYNQYQGDVTDREYLPIFWTGFYVNNNYGNDAIAKYDLQQYIDSLDKSKKYFTIIQYDDAILNDVSGLDLYQFNMSKTYDYPLPLIGQPHPYIFTNPEKKYLANFVGGLTHPIREHAKTLQGKEGYYISFDRHDPYEYCKILSESVFTLAYMGYGKNSFRFAESMLYGSIPIYVADKHIFAHNLDFTDFSIVINAEDVNYLEKIVSKISQQEIDEKLAKIATVYDEYFTYQGCYKQILNHLKWLNQ